MSKREPQIILKTNERKIVLEMGLEGKFAAKSSGWDENLLRTTSSKYRSRRPLGADPQAFGPAAGRRAGQSPTSHGTVTVSLRSDGVTATPQHRCVTLSPVAVESVANEKAREPVGPGRRLRRLRSLLRNHAENDAERVADERSLMTAGSAPIFFTSAL
jgi:hypothetical protein